MPVLKSIDLSYEEVAEKLNYDPDTGVFRWIKDSTRRAKAGDIAGCFKGTRYSRKTGLATRYMYIWINKYEVPAARLAWLLMHKEWPVSNILFVDGNSENLKFSNLTLGKQITYTSECGTRKQRVMPIDVQRNYGLKRFYGIDLAKYQEMLLAQNGVCAICFKPETSVVNGKIKPLAVDHCHNSDKIRGLLCARCNQAIGLLGEDVNVLTSAIDYLRNHTITDTN